MSEEDHITELETQIPAISGSAFMAARAKTLESGQSVLSTEEGVIYLFAPDGTRKEIKKIEAPTLIQKGTMVPIQ